MQEERLRLAVCLSEPGCDGVLVKLPFPDEAYAYFIRTALAREPILPFDAHHKRIADELIDLALGRMEDVNKLVKRNKAIIIDCLHIK
ncbi:MAG: hypothetical protein H3C30_04530 [Candidatus Hydrogenedentes bacterium]|nr:hypothetical protein [Candidatus Hydrogenedentota bacterium]